LRPRIVIPDDSPPVISGTPALERIKAGGDVTLHTTPPASREELLQRISGAHTVVNIRAYCKFPRDVLEAMSASTRHLAIWGTGTDNVDLTAARDLGIVVSNTPNTATDAIAEHCLALLLAVARRVPQVDASVKQGRWIRGMLYQCYGKTLGVVGTGVIGTRFAELARAVGMKVLAWTFHPDPAKASRSGFEYVSTLEELLRRSDIVSLHLRSSDQTRGMFGEDQFALMKTGAILINTARGDMVDEQALASALASGKLLGAGLDVFAQEPIAKTSPLLGLDNVVLSPHTAGTTPEALQNGLMRCAGNVVAFIETGEVLNRVV
jgi:D-3-phosphoglycerate dehydrogenase